MKSGHLFNRFTKDPPPMHPLLLSLPDAPFAELLTAATGRALTVEADALGRWCRAKTASGALLIVRPGAAGPTFRYVAPATASDRLDRGGLADLEAHRGDLEVLARWADMVNLSMRGLTLADVRVACDCRLAADIAADANEDETIVAEVTALALGADLDIGDDGTSPGEAFIDLAFAARELRIGARVRVVNAVEHAVAEVSL